MPDADDTLPARPNDPASAESKQYLQKLRSNLRNRLFGSTGARERAAASADAPPRLEQEDPARIGRFVVIKRIGKGGMGVVYAAYDDTLDRKVAVKLLHDGGHVESGGSDGRARLLREAQAIARLSHPAVVHVYEVGTFKDQVYVAMEYVDGPTLKVWQTQEVRTWREILGRYVAAGRGLEAAHEASIVHRDFKADNVLVRIDASGPSGVRVLDFGLARTEQRKDDDRPPLVDDSAEVVPLTKTGAIMGTPAYMAPEQHMGLATDPRTDQFSFCVSLFEALYGFRPFAGQTLGELRRNVLNGNVEPAPRYTEVPPRIRKSLLRGLLVDPAARYETMGELLAELERSPGALFRRLAVALLLVMVVAAGIVTWWSASEDEAARQAGQRLRDEFEHARVVRAEEEIRRARSRSVSEKWDELVMAYARDSLDTDPTRALAALKHLTPGNDSWLLGARTIAADAELRGVIHQRYDLGDLAVRAMAFAPDGRTIALGGVGGRIELVDVATGTITKLAGPTSTVRALAFDRGSSTRLAAVGDDGFLHRFALGSDAAPYEPVFLSEAALRAVAYGEDRTIAAGGNDGKLRLVDEDGTIVRTLTDHAGAVRAVAFDPSGQTLASGSDDGSVMIWYLDRGKHRAVPVLEAIKTVAFLDDGDIVAALAEDGRIGTWETYTALQRKTPFVDVRGTGVSTSADGRMWLVATADGPLELRELGAQDASALSRSRGRLVALGISPDATLAAAVTDDRLELWRVGPDERGRRYGGAITAAATGDGSLRKMAFLPDGSTLISGSRTGVVRRWDVAAAKLTELGRFEAAIAELEMSPTGEWVAVVAENGGSALIRTDGGETREPLAGTERGIAGRPPRWSPDGALLGRTSCVGWFCQVLLYDVALDEAIELAQIESEAIALSFSPTGRYVLSDHRKVTFLWDSKSGESQRFAWPGERSPGARLATAFAAEGEVRIATTPDADDPTKLQVWQLGSGVESIHLLFEESGLRTLLGGDDGRSLLIGTEDGHNILWTLSDDAFRVLPDDLPTPRTMVVAPDRGAIVLLGDSIDDARLIDIESGLARQLPRLVEPIAWSVDGTLADSPQMGRVRRWIDPSPNHPSMFLTWLEETTKITIASPDIR